MRVNEVLNFRFTLYIFKTFVHREFFSSLSFGSSYSIRACSLKIISHIDASTNHAVLSFYLKIAFLYHVTINSRPPCRALSVMVAWRPQGREFNSRNRHRALFCLVDAKLSLPSSQWTQQPLCGYPYTRKKTTTHRTSRGVASAGAT